MSGTTSPSTVSDPKFASVNLNYVIMAFNLFLPMLCLVALARTFLKSGEVTDTWLASHYNWQKKTCLVYVGGLSLGLITFQYVIGLFLTGAVIIWSLYRLLRGFSALYSGNSLPDEWV